MNAVAFADISSQILFSGGDDAICKVWDRRTMREDDPKPVGALAGHQDGITFIDSKVSKETRLHSCALKVLVAQEGVTGTGLETQKLLFRVCRNWSLGEVFKPRNTRVFCAPLRRSVYKDQGRTYKMGLGRLLSGEELFFHRTQIQFPAHTAAHNHL